MWTSARMLEMLTFGSTPGSGGAAAAAGVHIAHYNCALRPPGFTMAAIRPLKGRLKELLKGLLKGTQPARRQSER